MKEIVNYVVIHLCHVYNPKKKSKVHVQGIHEKHSFGTENILFSKSSSEII